ncbi:hypothetical protein, partial [Pseudomonas kulmbachensis]|uniref:hypothetical protein n=1 Tax=Pseudomonas kulmbachensis TaxID=3043408 RepID=UPI00375494A3
PRLLNKYVWFVVYKNHQPVVVFFFFFPPPPPRSQKASSETVLHPQHQIAWSAVVIISPIRNTINRCCSVNSTSAALSVSRKRRRSQFNSQPW